MLHAYSSSFARNATRRAHRATTGGGAKGSRRSRQKGDVLHFCHEHFLTRNKSFTGNELGACERPCRGAAVTGRDVPAEKCLKLFWSAGNSGGRSHVDGGREAGFPMDCDVFDLPQRTN
jgi:hypothetical protein